MELNQLIHEIFIYENLVTLTLIFFNKKFISRNILVQLNRKRKNKQKGLMQKAFFFEVMVWKTTTKTTLNGRALSWLELRNKLPKFDPT